jgi:hypothetical protein
LRPDGNSLRTYHERDTYRLIEIVALQTNENPTVPFIGWPGRRDFVIWDDVVCEEMLAYLIFFIK